MIASLLLAAFAVTAPIEQGLAEPGCGSGGPQPVSFPMTTYQGHVGVDADCYLPDQNRIAQINALRDYRCVSMQGLSLPGTGPVLLDLTRIDDVAPENITLNGSLPGAIGNPTATDMSLWYGSVRFHEGSRACLAFSEVGVWGWVRTSYRLYQIASFPKDGDWTNFYTLIVDDRHKNQLSGYTCGDVIDEPADLPPDYTSCLAGLNGAGGWKEECDDTPISQLRLCRMAVETDYQFYQRFGDVAAAEVYARFVIGAVAQQLRIAARVVVRINYLGLHANPLDPWTEPDSPQGSTASPCCVDAVYEFQHRWGTQDLDDRVDRFNLGPGFGLAPIDADMYHFMSGAIMGCGVAMGKLGVDEDVYSLSAVMGALNFDRQNTLNQGTIIKEPMFSPYFQVHLAGHEIGHNFGGPHTHSIRYDVAGTPADPSDDVPIDRCARQPDGSSSDCSQMGFAQATLMSYCHGCAPEFLRNLRQQFHPQMAKCLRNHSASLPEFEDIHFVTDLGHASAPAGQTPPELHFSGYSPGRDRAQLTATNIPTYDWWFVILSYDADYLPFHGGVIVPGVDILWNGQPDHMPVDFALPYGIPNGLVVYAQQAFVHQGQLYLSNAIAVEMIR